MGKVKFIIIGVIALIIFATFFILVRSSETPAYLNIESGIVEVDTGSGWQKAVDQMELGLNDKVKTKTGKASIVLKESVIVSLEQNTEVSILDLSKKHLKIKQDSGSTWNKFTGLVGIEEFSVETPNTVASVRGTYFNVNTNSILVGEGTVEVKAEGETENVKGGNKALFGDGELSIEKMSPSDYAKMITNMKQNVEEMKDLRQKEIEKHPGMMKILQTMLSLDDQDIQTYLDKADTGGYDLDKYQNKIPVQTESVKKVRILTDKIIEQNNLIEEMQKNSQR